MKQYIAKPITVSALQFNGVNHEAMREFVGKKMTAHNRMGDKFFLNTMEGMLLVCPTDYIVRGIHGEFTLVRENTFNETYTEIETC